MKILFFDFLTPCMVDRTALQPHTLPVKSLQALNITSRLLSKHIGIIAGLQK